MCVCESLLSCSLGWPSAFYVQEDGLEMPDPSPHYSGIIGVYHHTCFYGAGIELSALYLLDKCSRTELRP